MRITLLILLIFIGNLVSAQTYFPPITGNQWETKSASDLGWCTDSIPALLDFVGQNNSKAFLVLVDGRIVIEKYYGTFSQDSFWYWASAGKSMLATVVGIAAEQKLLNINHASSTYLNSGWTNCSTTDEQKIKIVHQLSMSSGINDIVPDLDCTEPSCLTCLAEPGTRWAYHNAVYTLLEEVIVNASNQTLNQFLNINIKLKTGMNGLYLKQGYNNVYYSTARSMARFGLLAQNNFVWNNDTVLKDGTFKTQMTNSSQNINPSYGYLWWLNGKNKFMLPRLQIVFNGMLIPNAPADMYSAMGKNGQLINVIPSKKMVVVRMGNKPADQSELPMIFNNEIWKRLNTIMCNATSVSHQAIEKKVSAYPNPSQNEIFIDGITNFTYCIKNVNGQVMQEGISEGNKISVEKLPVGVYSLEIEGKTLKIVKI